MLLIFSGAAWFLIGFSMLRHQIDRFTKPHVWPPNPILDFMNDEMWGWLWMACGLGAILVGALHRWRGVHRRDVIGFNLILLPSIVWALFYLWSWGVALYTSEHQGRGDSFYGFIVWTLVTGFIMVIAGWPDPPSTIPTWGQKPPEGRL